MLKWEYNDCETVIYDGKNVHEKKWLQTERTRDGENIKLVREGEGNRQIPRLKVNFVCVCRARECVRVCIKYCVFYCVSITLYEMNYYITIFNA